MPQPQSNTGFTPLSMARTVAVTLIILAFLSNVIEAQAQCTATWANAAGGLWTEGANWNSGAVPTSSDNVCITADGQYTVVINAATTINSLTLGSIAGSSGPTLTTTAGLTLGAQSVVQATGTLDWQGGTIAGGSTLTNLGTIILATPSTKFLNASTLVNSNTVVWTGGLFRIDNQAKLDNRALFDIQVDNHIDGGGSGPNTIINAAGSTIRKSVATGLSIFISDVTLVNNGLIDAQAGVIDFDGRTTHTNATLYAGADAAITFTSGVHTIVGTLQGEPDGIVALSGALLDAHPAGATLDFGGAGFLWEAGSVGGGSSGAGQVTNVGQLHMSSGNTKFLADSTTLVNTGTVTWSGGLLRIDNKSTIENRNVFDIRVDNNVDGGGTGPNTFVNASGAVMRKTAGVGTSIFIADTELRNFGIIDVQTGVIDFDGKTTHTNAILDASTGAALTFTSGVHTIVGTLSGTPEGVVSFGGTLLAAHPDGATMDFEGSGFQWVAGSIGGASSGAGRLTNAGQFEIGSVSVVFLSDSTTLVNDGTVTWSGGLFRIDNRSTFENRNVFEIRVDNNVDGGGVGPNRFINGRGATMRKTAGAGTTIFIADTEFSNFGLVDAQAGVIDFDGKTTHTDAVLAASTGAAITFTSGTHTIVGTLAGIPDGVISFSGTLLQSHPDGGALDFGGAGFRWDAGSVGGGKTGGGRLTNNGSLLLSSNNSKFLADSTTIINSGTVDWTGGLFRIDNNSTFENRRLFDVRVDNNVDGGGNGPNRFVNAAGGIFRKTAGVGSTFFIADMTLVNRSGATISIESGTLDVDGVFVNQESAVIQGSSALNISSASVDNQGVFAPGLSPGSLTIVGNLGPWQELASLEIELGGLEPVTQYDRLVVAGPVSLGGTLDLHLVNGFTPSLGDEFVVLTSTGLSGSFSNADANGGLITRDGLKFAVSYAGNQVTVQYEGLVCTTEWTGAADDNWSNGSNWSDGVPGTADDACIIADGTYGVTLDVDADVASLTLGGADGVQTLSLPAGSSLKMTNASSVRTNGILVWNGGGLLDVGSSLANRGHVELVGDGTHELATGSLVNLGTVTHVEGVLRLQEGADFANEAGALYELGNDVDVEQHSDGLFSNRGTIRKSAGDGSARFLRSGGDTAVAFANDFGGRIEVVVGTVEIQDDFEHRDGAMIAGAGTFVPPTTGFVLNGDVSPGLSIGTLKWDGDYEPTVLSELNIELGSAGSSDVLAVTGVAALGGGLRLSIVDGYDPMVDDGFDIITAESFTGAFDEITSVPGLSVSFGGGGGLRLSITEVSVGTDEVPPTPSALELEPGYPNPVSHEATFVVKLPEPAAIDVRVYDILGREVAVLTEDERAAGRHELTWHTSGIPAGAYFVRVTVLGRALTQQVVVVK